LVLDRVGLHASPKWRNGISLRSLSGRGLDDFAGDNGEIAHTVELNLCPR
jgi:hypothetical protein